MSRRTSVLSRILLPITPERIVREQLERLRTIEAANAYLPRFDEKTLPTKRAGQSEIDWRGVQLDALQAWVRRMMPIAEDVETRARCSAALKQVGAA